MYAEPPWEWVDGDRTRAALYGASYLGVFGAGVLLTFADWLHLLEVGNGLTGPAVPAWVTSPIVPLVYLALAVPLILVPRRWAIVRRLGISPVGLRFILPIRKVVVAWSQVRSVDRESVTVERRSVYFRFKLTKDQARRLGHFVQPR